MNGNSDIWLGSAAYSTAVYGTSPALAQCVGNGESKPGGPNPCAIPAFGDTKLTYLYGQLRFLQANTRDYSAWIGYLTLTYSLN